MTGIPANKTAERATLKKEKNARNTLKERIYTQDIMQLRILMRMASYKGDEETGSLAFSVLNAEKSIWSHWLFLIKYLVQVNKTP